MKNMHTVEKIGGTSMSRFGELMDNILIGKRSGADLYNRIFVVSAYGGITNLLLEDKKTGAPGIYGLFAAGDNDWELKLAETRNRMIEYNRSFESLGLDQTVADNFVNERMDGIRDSLRNILKLRTYGHFRPAVPWAKLTVRSTPWRSCASTTSTRFLLTFPAGKKMKAKASKKTSPAT